MSDLIARLEAATEGSRELDADILALSDYRSTKAYRGWIMMQAKGAARDDRTYLLRFAPHYTTSLDAAMTMVPEADDRCLEITIYCTGTEVDLAYGNYLQSGLSWAKTTPIALCIAALKAREATND